MSQRKPHPTPKAAVRQSRMKQQMIAAHVAHHGETVPWEECKRVKCRDNRNKLAKAVAA